MQNPNSIRRFFISAACTLGIAFLLSSAAAIRTAEAPGSGRGTIVGSCTAIGGTWIEGRSECEYAEPAWCARNGGSFVECASACRNEPSAAACDLRCVPLCGFADTDTLLRKEPLAPDVRDASFLVQGMTISLRDGYAIEPPRGAYSGRSVTKIYGDAVFGDLDGDGDSDAGIVLSRESGGSVFFFIAAGTLERDGFRGTEALLLPPGSPPDTLEIKDGMLIAGFKIESAGAATHSIKEMRFRLSGDRIIADPS